MKEGEYNEAIDEVCDLWLTVCDVIGWRSPGRNGSRSSTNLCSFISDISIFVFITGDVSCAIRRKLASSSDYDVDFLFCRVVFIFESILLVLYFNLFNCDIGDCLFS